MGNVIKMEFDPDIKLDPAEIGDMPSYIEAHLLANITIYAKRHGIHWTKVAWSVTMQDGQPIIKLKAKE